MQYFTLDGKMDSLSQGGWEWDLVMLAAVLSIIVAGPGIVSIAHLVKKIPRFLQ
ncbi:MAG: hypothetical protein ACE5RJ_04735 [Nitrosopumilaceae archaeon]